jgi:DNA-directed RNA polymerase specialized sigma24 family protein
MGESDKLIFNDFFKRETENLRAYIKRKKDPKLSPYYLDDVFNDTYVSMYQTYFEPKYNVKGEKGFTDDRLKVYFTCSYATNRLKHAIENKRHNATHVDISTRGVADNIPDITVESNNNSTRIDHCLAEAESIYGDVIMLLVNTYIKTDRCTYKKLSEMTGIDLPTVKTAMREARKTINICLTRLKRCNK